MAPRDSKGSLGIAKVLWAPKVWFTIFLNLRLCHVTSFATFKVHRRILINFDPGLFFFWSHKMCCTHFATVQVLRSILWCVLRDPTWYSLIVEQNNAQMRFICLTSFCLFCQSTTNLCNPQQNSLSASAIVIDTKIEAGAEKEICNGKKREMQVATAAVARVG